ncbi:MAG: class I SAM-dependent methyltransferase [Merismopedia sp. SIO2A8]|nr:class I SAM-dependent methyltransferase [Merismopedia sp. SIO2A8]
MHVSPLSQIQRRLFAWCMATVNDVDQEAVQCDDSASYRNMAAYKHGLLGNLQGTVLEIGPGTGANFVYYPADIEWIGIEPNPFMHPYLQQEATQQGFQTIQLYSDSVENLPMENESIDVIVSTHVLCSVTQLDQAFQEIVRVLKPGGRFIFFEHVGATPQTWTRTLQNGVTPAWKVLFDGCYPNRETWHVLDVAGFTSVDYEAFQLELPVVSPHIAGVAVK